MHIAVVIPAFNVAAFLQDTILSVLAQTHPDWSLIVVDDGSTDQTAAVADRFGDPRIRLIRQSNAGVSAARNAGVVATTACDAFLFLDGDDWLAPHAFATLAEALDASPWAVAACAPFVRVAADGRTGLAAAAVHGCLLKRLLTRNLFANGGHVLISAQAVKGAGGFRRDLAYGEDWEFWTRLALLGEFTAVRSAAPVLFVRERPGSAYLLNAANPAAYRPVIEAIYDNPDTLRRVAAAELGRLRQRAEAEIAWTVGRELLRHGQDKAGRRWLVRSVRKFPSLKRFVLLGLSLLDAGPFRPYQSDPAAPTSQ